MYKFVYEGEYDEEHIDLAILSTLIAKHRSYVLPKLQRCKEYYEGEHDIANRAKKDSSAPNNKIVCNHAQDITNTATGYFLANPINYSVKSNDEQEMQALDRLTDAFDEACTDEVDHDNGLDLSITGVAYEYVYAKDGEAVPLSKNLNASNTFMVVDDSIEENELFAVYYWTIKGANNNKIKYRAQIMTEHYIHHVELNSKYGAGAHPVTSTPIESHNFGEVPVIFYQNNKHCFGDFEQQIPLIDAYNTLMSDRVNDKEQFLDSIMVLYGAIMGEDKEQTKEAMIALKDLRLLELPRDAKAEYLTRTLDESGVEVLRKALKHDIYTFSHVPDLSDENFAGNTSGVAMEYKLLGLEMITKTKSRYYQKGIKKRIRLYSNYLNLKNFAINPTSIEVTFKRGLPRNILELSQMVSNLKDSVSQKTLISQLPFVEDPDGEILELDAQREKNIELQQEYFARTANDEIDEETDDETVNRDGELLGKT